MQSFALSGLVAQESTLSAASAAAPPRAALGGTALVANQGSASATLVEVASGRARTVDVRTGPHEAAISPDGRRGVVSI